MPSSIDFDAQNGKASKINYSVPLPGQNSGKRIIQLELNLNITDFLDTVRTAGETYFESAGLTKSNLGVDIKKATSFLRKHLLSMGYASKKVERALSTLPELLGNSVSVKDKRDNSNEFIRFDPEMDNLENIIESFVTNANAGVVTLPTRDSGGAEIIVEVPEENTEPNPQLFLIETYGISSFLGDYGMGRTIRTFTLLPGESTTIRLKTWQSSKKSIKESSSIIDSSEQSAKDRFSNKIQNETTDKKTQSKTKKWAVQAEAKASWGWGSASVKASAEGEYHSGREQFARSTSEAVGEHANEASSKRELSVTSSSETEIDIGEETSVERVINNVNMRRVLNFVFRELNQTYTTKLHLKGIYVGFTNERKDTWRQVPISGLRGLLEEVLKPNPKKIDEIAQRILKISGTIFNANDLPVRVLEKVTYDPVQDTSTVGPVVLDAVTGDYLPPTKTEYYRFKQGALEQDGVNNPVDGVLLSEQTIVMRTDSVIVEALLGQADALDNYSMEIQEAAAKKETIANEREELILATLEAIGDPEIRAKMASIIFNKQANTGT